VTAQVMPPPSQLGCCILTSMLYIVRMSDTKDKQLPALLSISQAAKALDISNSAITHAIQRGKLQCVRFDTVTLITRVAIEQYIKTRRVGRPIGWRKKP
jgi:excisionase family DNA binding protein